MILDFNKKIDFVEIQLKPNNNHWGNAIKCFVIKPVRIHRNLILIK